VSAPTGTGHRHHALFYDSTDALLTAAVPFLRAGLDAGEAAVLVCRRDRNALLADALGDHPRLTIVDQADVYTRTGNAMAMYRRMMRRHIAAHTYRVRVVGEVAFGTDPSTWAEWIRFEAVVNAALAPYPLSSVCAYDTCALPEPVLTGARHTHPLLLTSTTERPNPDYVAPVPFLRRCTTVEPDPLQTTAPTHAFDDLTDPNQIADVRHQLGTTAFLSAMPAQTRSDLVAAVAEVAANGLIHGRPPVRVRIWLTPTRVLCTVTDHGPGFDDPLAGYPPRYTSNPHHAGAGLWLARQTCDRLDMTTTPDGFTVRLSTAIPTTSQPMHRPGTAQARGEATQRQVHNARARAEQLQRRLDEIDAQILARHPNVQPFHRPAYHGGEKTTDSDGSATQPDRAQGGTTQSADNQSQ
jgi:anti-sigma regulatory factor (Ser/Thr protein kinase)